MKFIFVLLFTAAWSAQVDHLLFLWSGKGKGCPTNTRPVLNPQECKQGLFELGVPKSKTSNPSTFKNGKKCYRNGGGIGFQNGNNGPSAQLVCRKFRCKEGDTMNVGGCRRCRCMKGRVQCSGRDCRFPKCVVSQDSTVNLCRCTRGNKYMLCKKNERCVIGHSAIDVDDLSIACTSPAPDWWWLGENDVAEEIENEIGIEDEEFDVEYEVYNEEEIGAGEVVQTTNWFLYLFLIGLCAAAGYTLGLKTNQKQVSFMTGEAEVELVEGGHDLMNI